MYIYTNNFKKLAFYFIERNRYSEQVRMLDVVYSSYSIRSNMYRAGIAEEVFV